MTKEHKVTKITKAIGHYSQLTLSDELTFIQSNVCFGIQTYNWVKTNPETIPILYNTL